KIDEAQALRENASPANFGGEVRIQRLVGAEQSGEVEILVVYFSAGGRTRPHVHVRDQVLQIVSGQGFVATETERRLVGPGDVITIPAGAWHWHGATRDTPMCHLSIKQPGPTDWSVDERNWATYGDS
ncbi:MAG TPA: cupin domain-containing protein, partial [Roseiflexaceae bacterium]|nr:cupin domain-containing protein [Roseiflexaceae bacterium]